MVAVRDSGWNLTQIKYPTKAHDANHSALTLETVEPEPPSGKATNPINLNDEADENSAPPPESYSRFEKVYGGTIHDDDDGTQPPPRWDSGQLNLAGLPPLTFLDSSNAMDG
jgi:hypothetical protein